jgi:Ca2+-binding EF-hand superfamily protein
MSVAPISDTAVTGQANAGSTPIAPATSNAPATPTAADTSAPIPSTTVTLSAQAQALSAAAADGLTMTVSSLKGLDKLPANPTAADLEQLFSDNRSAIVTPPTDGKKAIGVVSKDDFSALMNQFNASNAQAAQLFQALDTDGNQSISNSELLAGLAKTADASDPTAQLLLATMNTNGDGSVDSAEFEEFETGFVAAEKVPS